MIAQVLMEILTFSIQQLTQAIIPLMLDGAVLAEGVSGLAAFFTILVLPQINGVM